MATPNSVRNIRIRPSLLVMCHELHPQLSAATWPHAVRAARSAESEATQLILGIYLASMPRASCSSLSLPHLF